MMPQNYYWTPASEYKNGISTHALHIGLFGQKYNINADWVLKVDLTFDIYTAAGP